MAAVTRWLYPQTVALDLDAASKWDALHAVSSMVESSKLSGPAVFRALWRREMAASTGIGNGLAIPHARIAGITEPVTAYVRTRNPVNFAAPDGKQVSELFIILVPDDGDNATHLALLALVAEVFSEPAFRALLDAAAQPDDVRSAFSGWISERPTASNGRASRLNRAAPAGR